MVRKEPPLNLVLRFQQDLTAVFAVGNCGEYNEVRCPQFFADLSISFPATAKNSIGVGAVGNPRFRDSQADLVQRYR